jgi:hypothetical protein
MSLVLLAGLPLGEQLLGSLGLALQPRQARLPPVAQHNEQCPAASVTGAATR